MKILVTGGSGFVGSVLLPLLLSRREMRGLSAFLPPGEELPAIPDGAEVRVVRGDIRDREAVVAACRGHDHVIHMAARISYRRRDARVLMAVNRDGTSNVIQGCLRAGVKRLVHISTEAAVGFHADGRLADESTPFNWPDSFVYAVSKFEGQKLVESAAKDGGLSAVILNPASIMGPGDPNPDTPHNRLYRMALRGSLAGSFSGGLAVVDVRDLVAVIIRALSVGEPGEKHLVVGANVAYRDVVRALGRAAGRRAAALPVPAPVLTAAGSVLEAFSSLTGGRPLLTRAYGRLSGWRIYHSNEKSRRVFGHAYIDFEKTVRDGLEFHRGHFTESRDDGRR